MDGFVETIKQYPGQQQVDRSVKVFVPGKHFPALQPVEQRAFYEGTAIEFSERHKFDRHVKAWGAPHIGPGIRFVCDSDAMDDPDHKGFWTTLGLWNRWRHDTFKDKREAELEYLDELPAAAADTVSADAPKEAVKQPPAVKQYFSVVASGMHTIGGSGKMQGKVLPFHTYACNMPGCKRGAQKPIKQLGADTGLLFAHLSECQPELCLRLRAGSAHSPVQLDEHGVPYSLYSFDESLPHYARFVEKCFRGLDHFYDTRADNGLIEWLRGYDPRATLPHEQTCQQLLEVCPRPATALPHCCRPTP